MSNQLTNIEQILQYISKDEIEMKGVIRPISRQRYCPDCRKKVKRSYERGKEGYVCPSCNWRPERFYIDLWWHNKNYPLCSDRTGQALDSYERAKTLLAVINFEIQNHTFDPSNYTKASIEKYLFRTQIENWLKEKEIEKNKGNRAPSTLKTYRTYRRKYYSPFFDAMDVREIRAADIRKFYNELPPLSLKYQDSLLKILESFFNWLLELEIIDKKPSFKGVDIDVPETTPAWLDRPTQDAIIACIEDERDRPIYTLLTRQGIRPSESRALKKKDLDLELGTITVERTFSEHEIVEKNKEKKAKTRLLNPELIHMLKELCKDKFPEDFVFINFRTRRPYNRNKFNEIWNKACQKAGVNIRLYNGTRHSIGTQAARAGIPDSEIAEILNHADDRMVKKHYVNKDDLERQRVVFERINKVVSIQEKKGTLNKP